MKNLSSDGAGVGGVLCCGSGTMWRKKQEHLSLLSHHFQDLTIPPPVYLSDFFLKGPGNRILFHFPFQFHGKNLSQTLKLFLCQMVSHPSIPIHSLLPLPLPLPPPSSPIKRVTTPRWVEQIISLSPHRCILQVFCCLNKFY